MPDWRDQLAGHRMQVDRNFADRIQESELTNREWSLVMTAVEFEIEGEGADAQLVADTSRIDAVVSEFDTIQPGGGILAPYESSSEGIWELITEVIGSGPRSDTTKRESAIELANDYAEQLQIYLEEQGQWKSIRQAASHQSTE